MRRLLVSVAVLVALAGAAQATARDTAARKPVLAATASGLTYHVFYADPVSLRALAGRRSWSCGVQRRIAVTGRRMARGRHQQRRDAPLRSARDHADSREPRARPRRATDR